MKIMDYFWIILALFSIYLIFGTTITFSPFSIKFETMMNGFGILFIIIGISLTQYDNYKRGYDAGIDKGLTSGIKLVENALNEAIKTHTK